MISVICPIRGIHPEDEKSNFRGNIEETSNRISASVTSVLRASTQLREATIIIVISVILSVSQSVYISICPFPLGGFS